MPIVAVEGVLYSGVVGVTDDSDGDAALGMGDATVIVGATRQLKSGIVGGVESVSERVDDIAGCIAGVVAKTSSSAISGFSKSQGTPCLTQLPHFGWTSSHYGRDSQYRSPTSTPYAVLSLP